MRDILPLCLLPVGTILLGAILRVLPPAVSSLTARWEWDWVAFWPQFIATSLAIVASGALLWLGNWLDRRRESFERARRLQVFCAPVLADLDQALEHVNLWLAALERKDAVREFDPLSNALVWDIGSAQMADVLLAQGLWQPLSSAFGWYRQSVVRVTDVNKCAAYNEDVWVLGVGTLVGARRPITEARNRIAAYIGTG